MLCDFFASFYIGSCCFSVFTCPRKKKNSSQTKMHHYLGKMKRTDQIQWLFSPFIWKMYTLRPVPESEALSYPQSFLALSSVTLLIFPCRGGGRGWEERKMTTGKWRPLVTFRAGRVMHPWEDLVYYLTCIMANDFFSSIQWGNNWWDWILECVKNSWCTMDSRNGKPMQTGQESSMNVAFMWLLYRQLT